MTITLPGYRIIREIGAGGFGRVFQATEERTGKTVAVKILQTSKGQAFRRFRREGKALWRNLTNPHVVTLIEQEFDGFWPYLVMEFLEGQTLTEAINEGPIPAVRMCRIGAQIARAASARGGRYFEATDAFAWTPPAGYDASPEAVERRIAAGEESERAYEAASFEADERAGEYGQSTDDGGEW